MRRKAFFFISFLLLSTAFFAPASAQANSSTVYFLGRSDTNSDGLIDPNDPLALYSGVSDGSSAAKISANDASLLQYDVSSNEQIVAYTARTSSSGNVLDVYDTQGRSSRRINIADLTPVSVQAFSGVVWLVGLNANAVPVLRGYAPVTGAILGEHTFRAPNTSVVVQAQGGYALAYNAQSGGLTVLALPGMTPVQFPLDGYALTPPAWSPTNPVFAIGIAESTPATSGSIVLVDARTGQSAAIGSVALRNNSALTVEWSSQGEYVVVGKTNTRTNVVQELTFIDARSQTATPVDAGNLLSISVLDWAPNDAFALLSEQAADGTPLLAAVNPATGSVTVLGSETLSANTNIARWSPTAPDEIAVLGQSLTSGAYGAYLVSLVENATQTLVEGNDPTAASGFVNWTRDGQTVLFTAASFDNVFTSTGTPLALYSVTTSDQVVNRLSPDNVVIEIGSVRAY